jgi:hypothetical protein
MPAADSIARSENLAVVPRGDWYWLVESAEGHERGAVRSEMTRRARVDEESIRPKSIGVFFVRRTLG